MLFVFAFSPPIGNVMATDPGTMTMTSSANEQPMEESWREVLTFDLSTDLLTPRGGGLGTNVSKGDQIVGSLSSEWSESVVLLMRAATAVFMRLWESKRS
jgi:hypothetical protein